jgi:hypothetical protein
MRFNIFAASFALIFVAVVFLSWVIGRDMTSDNSSPVRGVQSSGQVFDYQLDPSCVQYQKPGGDIEIVCPGSITPDNDTRLIIEEKPQNP